MAKKGLTMEKTFSFLIIILALLPGLSYSTSTSSRALELKELRIPLRELLLQKEKKEAVVLKEKSEIINEISNFNSQEISSHLKSYYNTNLFDSPFISWGIAPKFIESNINLENAWHLFEKRKDIIVAVIDTGIDYSHPYLKNNIIVKEGNLGPSNYGVNFSLGNELKTIPRDTHGHGTHVSGIIKSIFPEVKILSLKYYSPSNSGSENLTATIKALRYAVDSNVDIINYSGGGPQASTEELQILKEANKKGILVVAAAGNDEQNLDNPGNNYYPASYGLPNIIGVMAHDKKAQVLSYSNFGKNRIDVSAPGENINSTLPLNRSGQLTGTSQATAFVTGVAALLKSNYPNLRPSQIKEIITQTARKEISLLNKCKSGGRLDAEAAMSMAMHLNTQNSIIKTLANHP